MKLPAVAPKHVERLDWDSDFFGIPVGRIRESESDPGAIAAALGEAEANEYELLYWLPDATTEGPTPPCETPGFAIGYTDHRVEYVLDLPAPAALNSASEIEITQHAGGPASEDLLDLAPAAGAYSRFQQDPRIAEAKFVALYRTWVTRSATMEFADTMLIASIDSRPVGFVTGVVDGESGSFGLMAVNDSYRGRGVGEQLLASFLCWLGERGATVAALTTQRDNPACRFFERAGFRVRSTSHLHHLWRARDTQ